jgi:hypothetical protein
VTRYPHVTSRAVAYREMPFRPCWNRVSGPPGNRVVLFLCYSDSE